MVERASLKYLLKEALVREMPLEYQTFRGEEITESFGERIEFRHVRFENCRLLSCHFSKTFFEEVEFINCDISNSNFTGSYWKQSKISSTKAQGTIFTDSVFKKMNLKGSKLDYANLGQVLLEDTKVEDCSFTSAFLSEMKFKRVTFVRDKFDSTDFFKTSLKGLDLSTCDLEGLLLSEDLRELKGAKLNAMQAVNVAKMLGILVI